MHNDQSQEPDPIKRPEIAKGIYQHYKGKRYEVVDVAIHSETLDPYVVYKALYGDYGIWIRPYGMFTESVNIDGQQIPRFKFLENETRSTG